MKMSGSIWKFRSGLQVRTISVSDAGIVCQTGAVQLAMADLSDEIHPFKISHLPRTDFELCILYIYSVPSTSTCATPCRCIDLPELDMLPMCPLDYRPISLHVNSGMLNEIRIVTYYTLPPLESPTSSWIAMAYSR